jgi:hypothetical protein
VTGFDIHHYAVRKSPALIDDGFQIGAVGVGSEHAASAKIQEEEAAWIRLSS